MARHWLIKLISNVLESRAVTLVVLAAAMISITYYSNKNYNLSSRIEELDQILQTQVAGRRLQDIDNNCPPCESNKRYNGGELSYGSNRTDVNAPWLTQDVKHVWKTAKDFYKYESPVTDFDMIQGNMNILNRFQTLPENFLSIQPDRLIKYYWMDNTESSHKGLGHHFAKCITDNLGEGNGIRGKGICVTRNQGMYNPMDAAILYSMIRFFQPTRVVEVGAGFSSGVVSHALLENAKQNKKAEGKHVVIEPYRSAVLEKLLREGAIAKEHVITIVKEKVQSVSFEHVDSLVSGDILFLDGSHVLQPYGDIIFEFLWLLPRLQPGVVVHVHDIWLPRDYPKLWMLDQGRQYTEQWLLGAFLHNNHDWEIIWPTNHMSRVKGDVVYAKGGSTYRKRGKYGGSFWFRRKAT